MPRYQHARNSFRDLRELTRGTADGEALAVPPEHSLHPGDRLAAWNRWWQWERSNPIKFTEQEAVEARVRYAYERSLLVLRHYPEAWISYSTYENGQAAVEILNRALSVIPESALLHMALSDAQSKYMTETIAMDLDVWAGLDILRLPAKDRSLLWIESMEAAMHRGDLKEARAIFARARKDPSISHHVFIAAALLEWHSGSHDAAVAGKIFELGMAKFSTNSQYVLEHLQFLLAVNDEQNARALFERAAQGLSVEDAFPIWQCYLSHVTRFGSDRKAVFALEERWHAAYPHSNHTSPLNLFLTRHTRYGLPPPSLLTSSSNQGTDHSDEAAKRPLANLHLAPAFVLSEILVDFLTSLPDGIEIPAVPLDEILKGLEGVRQKRTSSMSPPPSSHVGYNARRPHHSNYFPRHRQ